MLYSSSPKEILQGCGRVSAWMVKQDLPIAVEVTASLQKALHAEEENVNALSMAIIRFINGVVEPFKNVNLAVPISTIGSSYGIPEFIITIRHSATHGKMPTFEHAAHGARAALEWLKVNYWEEQLNLLNQIESDMTENILGFLLEDEKPFVNIPREQVLSFGIEALVGLVIKNRKKQSISLDFQKKVAELIMMMNKTYTNFGAGFAMRLAEEVAKGDAIASHWLKFLLSKQLVPENSVAMILAWGDPANLGKADPVGLVDRLPPCSPGPFGQRAWPPISMGRMPLSDSYLTLNADEWDFVDPIEPGDDVFAPVGHPVCVEEEEEPKSLETPAETLIEIW